MGSVASSRIDSVKELEDLKMVYCPPLLRMKSISWMFLRKFMLLLEAER
jgi:hypothetical protein